MLGIVKMAETHSSEIKLMLEGMNAVLSKKSDSSNASMNNGIAELRTDNTKFNMNLENSHTTLSNNMQLLNNNMEALDNKIDGNMIELKAENAAFKLEVKTDMEELRKDLQETKSELVQKINEQGVSLKPNLMTGLINKSVN